MAFSVQGMAANTHQDALGLLALEVATISKYYGNGRET